MTLTLDLTWSDTRSQLPCAEQETRRVQRAEETERQRLDAELAARTAASAAQLAQIEEQQKKIEAQVRVSAFIESGLL